MDQGNSLFIKMLSGHVEGLYANPKHLLKKTRHGYTPLNPARGGRAEVKESWELLASLPSTASECLFFLRDSV